MTDTHRSPARARAGDRQPRVVTQNLPALQKARAALVRPSRIYVVGPPVILDDNTVTAEVDLSEASDIWDGAPDGDDGTPAYSAATVEADSNTIWLAVERGEVKVTV